MCRASDALAHNIINVHLFAQCYSAMYYFSRTSLMTSRRPDTSKVYTNDPYWRDTYNFTTFPQYFKEKGYTSVGLGMNFSFCQVFDHRWHNKYSHPDIVCQTFCKTN